MDFQSAMETFAEAWVAANTGKLNLGAPSSNGQINLSSLTPPPPPQQPNTYSYSSISPTAECSRPNSNNIIGVGSSSSVKNLSRGLSASPPHEKSPEPTCGIYNSKLLSSSPTISGIDLTSPKSKNTPKIGSQAGGFVSQLQRKIQENSFFSPNILEIEGKNREEKLSRVTMSKLATTPSTSGSGKSIPVHCVIEVSEESGGGGGGGKCSGKTRLLSPSSSSQEKPCLSALSSSSSSLYNSINNNNNHHHHNGDSKNISNGTLDSSPPLKSKSAKNTVVEIDDFVIVPFFTPFHDIVNTVLAILGYPKDSFRSAEGMIWVKNWKPLRLDQVCDSLSKTVGDIFNDLTNHATLRVLVKRSKGGGVVGEDLKEKLLRLLLAQSSSLILPTTPSSLDETTIESMLKGGWGSPLGEDVRRRFDLWYNSQHNNGESKEISPHLSSGNRSSISSAKSPSSSPSKLYNSGTEDDELSSKMSSFHHSISPHLHNHPVFSGLVGSQSQKTRMRTSFDPEMELPKLQQWFSDNPHPSRHQIQQYVRDLNQLECRKDRKPLDINNVIYWFKNARAAQKRNEIRYNGLPPHHFHHAHYGTFSGPDFTLPLRTPQPAQDDNNNVNSGSRLGLRAGDNFGRELEEDIGGEGENSESSFMNSSPDENCKMRESFKKFKQEGEIGDDKDDSCEEGDAAETVHCIKIGPHKDEDGEYVDVETRPHSNSEPLLNKNSPSLDQNTLNSRCGEKEEENEKDEEKYVEEGDKSDDEGSNLSASLSSPRSPPSPSPPHPPSFEYNRPNSMGSSNGGAGVRFHPFFEHPSFLAYRHHLSSFPSLLHHSSGFGGGGENLGSYHEFMTPLKQDMGRGEEGYGTHIGTHIGHASPSSLSMDERRKRNRTFIDPVTEVPRLEQWFGLNTHPSHNLILKYTEELNRMPYRQKFPKLEPKNVQFWFKNRRAKCKRLKMTMV